MTERSFYSYLVVFWLALAAITFVALLFVPAPYGRFTRRGWGPRLSPRLGWVLMELPAVLCFLILYLMGDHRDQPASVLLLAFWMIHYVHRSLVYPFSTRGNRRQTTLVMVLLGMLFNTGNAYLNARWLYTLGPGYALSWLLDPRFLAGTALFWLGFALTKHSDRLLVHLRAPGETGYRIPYGGAYRYVSCPNYLGEMVQWGGWALACWSLGGLAFFVWTFANLAPRALSTHRWYRRTFQDYPDDRKALLPFLV
jgi:3-oxo-5-alpha-steroid 4-dehydrogenase 1